MKRPGVQGRILVLVCISLLLFSGVLLSCKGETLASPADSAEVVAVTISPEESYNPVMTQHTVVARVVTAEGNPAKGTTVEWILNRFPGAVGDIVSGHVAQGDWKADGGYAITKTDDNGEARLTITSTRPGDTDITAFVPAIENPAKHKVFAFKHWLNLRVWWPEDATNVTLTSHTFTTKLTTVVTESELPGYPEGWTTIRTGVGSGVPGYKVRWSIVDDDPPIYFGEGTQRAKEGMSTTGDSGEASATIRQVRAGKGENTIRVEVLAPDGVPMFQHLVKKVWVAPTLTLAKDGPEIAQVGDQLTYQLAVANTGDGDATRVTLKDTIPEGLSYVSSSPSGKVSGKIVAWDLGTLQPGSTKGLTLVLKAAKTGTWTNVAKASSVEGLEVEARAITKVVAPSVAIEKTGPSARYMSQNAEYVITVKNTGDVVLNDVTVRDQIPAGMDYVSSTIAGDVVGRTATWNLGSMNPGATKQFRVTLKCAQSGIWTNVATVTTREKVSDTGEQKTQIIAEAGATIQSTDTVDSVAVGQQTTYVITVRNQGDIDVHNVVIVVALPAQTRFLSVDLAPATHSVSLNSVTFRPVAVLPVGGELVYRITVQAISAGSALNRVTLTYDEFGKPVVVEEPTTIYSVD